VPAAVAKRAVAAAGAVVSPLVVAKVHAITVFADNHAAVTALAHMAAAITGRPLALATRRNPLALVAEGMGAHITQ
jgi:hypothetical protein